MSMDREGEKERERERGQRGTERERQERERRERERQERERRSLQEVASLFSYNLTLFLQLTQSNCTSTWRRMCFQVFNSSREGAGEGQSDVASALLSSRSFKADSKKFTSKTERMK